MHRNESFYEEKLDEVFYDSIELGDSGLDLTVPEVTNPKIFLHAISSSLSHKTMWVVGLLKNQMVVILINSSNSHKFLDPTLLKKVRLNVVPTRLHVIVANGAKIPFEGCCHSVPFRLQGHSIVTNFYLLTLGGCDIVLGVEWLRTLG